MNTENGDVRLAGSRIFSEGTVEVYHEETWGNTCWITIAQAQVVCRQLGFKGALKGYNRSPFAGARKTLPLGRRYNGRETSLRDCFKYNCLHTQAGAGIKCV